MNGLTLIEMLIGIVVSSVVLIGMGTMYHGAMMNYRALTNIRDSQFARTKLTIALTETTRQALRARGTDVEVFDDTGSAVTGNTTGVVLAYNYHVLDPDDSGVPLNWRQKWSGIVFKADDRLMKFDRHDMPGLSDPRAAGAGGDGFVENSTLRNAFTNPADSSYEDNLRRCEIIAMGVKDWSVQIEDDGTIKWRVDYLTERDRIFR